MSLPVNFFKSVNIRQSSKQEGGCLVHFVCLATTLLMMKDSPDISSLARNSCC